MDHNWIDIICLGALTFFLVTGIWKGFIKALFGLASIVAGALSAFSFTEQGVALVTNIYPDTPGFTPVIVAVLIFILSLIVVQYTGKYINTLINATPLNMANRLSGGALGIIKTYIFAIVLFGVLEYLAPLNGSLFDSLNESDGYAVYTNLPFTPEDLYAYPAETEVGKKISESVSDLKERDAIKKITHANETLDKLQEF
ncbi:MAG: CvpA family protein [Fibrobacterales bacterium]